MPLASWMRSASSVRASSVADFSSVSPAWALSIPALNAGIDKAQAGLTELKSATLEARTELADRIQDAKGMTARLERHAAAADQAAQRLEAVIARAVEARLPPPSRGRD